MGKLCKNCRFCERIYTKTLAGFYKEKAVYCTELLKAVSSDGYCDKFCYRTSKNKKTTLEFIDKVIKYVEELEYILIDY